MNQAERDRRTPRRPAPGNVARLDVRAIYRERNTRRVERPMPRAKVSPLRPPTLAAIARDVYGDGGAA
jgi:hypothetical protein